MCMLTYFPPGVQPNAARLTNGATWNDDGHGFAIVSKGQLIIHRSMDADYLIAQFVKMRALHPKGPALFHSRWGTGGKRAKENCHPFRFGNDSQTVVGHNGVLGDPSVQPGKKERRCDTRIAADEIMPSYADLDNALVMDDLAQWIGPGNKFVILTANPKYKRQAYIVNEKRGVWDGGVWYSNSDYEDYAYLSATADDSALAPANAWKDTCEFCGQMGAGIDDASGYCLTCGTCVDCLNEREECECAWAEKFYADDKQRKDRMNWWEENDNSIPEIVRDVYSGAVSEI